MGVVTEAVIKIHKKAEVENYGSVIFPDFESGFKFMREVAEKGDWPASLRFVDNLQFQFGMALKTENESRWLDAVDKIKKFYLLKIKGFDPDKMCLCTAYFVGDKQAVKNQEKHIYTIAKSHNGLKAGGDAGVRGYFLTFVIAYLRDFCLNFNFVAESFETCVAWDKAEVMIRKV